jgi:hypothetical protein
MLGFPFSTAHWTREGMVSELRLLAGKGVLMEQITWGEGGGLRGNNNSLIQGATRSIN